MLEPDQRTTPPLVADRFTVDARRGHVVGTGGTGGPARSPEGSVAHAGRRAGVDAEGVLSVDHGALRIGTMATPGWGREAVTYGPFERRAGRVVAVHLLNGHNTSESSAVGPLGRRLGRWALGSGTEPLWRRAWRYPTSRPREHLARKLTYWWRNRDELAVRQGDNLMAGWFPTAAAGGPDAGGSGLVVRATGAYNGELAATVDGQLLGAFHGLQNLPVHYVSVLREQGALHLAASSYRGAAGLPQHPHLRPIAIDDRPLPAVLHAGVDQAVLGQIGFSSDTRLYEVVVADEGSWSAWCTSAVVADRLTGPPAPFGHRRAERGGVWTTSGDDLVVGPHGVGLAEPAAPGQGRAHLAGPAPVGLVHAVVEGVTEGDEVVLSWRSTGTGGDHWRVTVGASASRLEVVVGGRVVEEATIPLSLDDGPHRVQVSDDGRVVRVAVDGVALTGAGWTDHVLAEATGVAVGLVAGGAGAGGGPRVRDLEAHPRFVEVPAALHGASHRVPLGTVPVVDDELLDAPLGDLAGPPDAPSPRWQRLMGTGSLAVVAPGVARFDASLSRPIPDRTAYTIDWSDPTGCDLEVTARSPQRQGDGAGQRCRVGLLIWQDPSNYFAVNIYLDDHYPAASASTFFHLRGFEDIYDAVWSNLGDLVAWNRTFRLRLACDGRAFVVLVDDEPVLHRAFSDVHPTTDRLCPNKVGIIANWEWGHDTGSTVQRFVARALPHDGQVPPGGGGPTWA